MTYPNTQLFIDGIWRDALDGRTLAVTNPATASAIGHVAHAAQADLDLALDAAARALPVWAATSAFDRYKLMRKAAELLRSRAEAIAAIMTTEQGKPLAEARMETLAAADVIDWFAEESRRTYGQVIPARRAGVTQLTIKQPVGPVAAFTPWNFPINQVVRKLSAAIAAGCSIIVKAPEETPASPAELIRCFADAGIPTGTINLVYGNPAEISSYLIAHPVIAKISFTGSTPVGKQLAALAGLHMKKSTMELGGHAPVLIFDDVDVEAVATLMAGNKFRNAGQVCVSPTRFLVQDGIADAFTERFADIAGKLRVGPGTDPNSQMGPLANERRIPALERMIADAVDKGGRLVTGGHRIGNAGWFFEPTVLADVPVSAEVMNEEPFGPLAVINRFDTVDTAIAEANRLRFGLAAYAFTNDLATANRLQDQIRSGMLTMNHLGLALPEVPFGGILDSGIGTEGGSEAINAYLDTRFVTRLDA
ncbi:MAG TPA: NAD-dependent succinate-semialdehyde dehydrogenase [Paenirhodobacter sp.]